MLFLIPSSRRSRALDEHWHPLEIIYMLSHVLPEKAPIKLRVIFIMVFNDEASFRVFTSIARWVLPL